MKKKVHGHTVGGRKSRTYRIWSGMQYRCYNESHRSYKDYGAKGIVTQPSWTGPGGFAAFLADKGECPSDDHSLDRIDPDQGYTAENTRWVLHSFNCARVRRVCHAKEFRTALDPEGTARTLSLEAWAKHLGISYDSLMRRIQRGWDDRAFSTKGRS